MIQERSKELLGVSISEKSDTYALLYGVLLKPAHISRILPDPCWMIQKMWCLNGSQREEEILPLHGPEMLKGRSSGARMGWYQLNYRCVYTSFHKVPFFTHQQPVYNSEQKGFVELLWLFKTMFLLSRIECVQNIRAIKIILNVTISSSPS